MRGGRDPRQRPRPQGGGTRKRTLKKLDAALDPLALKKNPTPTAADIKMLFVLVKGLARREQELNGELDRVPQTLTGRIRQLA